MKVKPERLPVNLATQRECVSHTSYMATSDSDTGKRDRLLARANRVRAELGLRPLTERQVEHDRSLADPSGLRLAALSDVCAIWRRDDAPPA